MNTTRKTFVLAIALLSFATIGISAAYADIQGQGYNQGWNSSQPTHSEQGAAVSCFGNDSYDAIKEEFEGKPADGFFRGLSKFHRYTIRYVSIVIIKYANMVVDISFKVKGYGYHNLALAMFLVGDLIFPLVVFALLIRGYRKSELEKVRFRDVVIFPVLLWILCVILYAIGMSAKACIFLFVLCPLVWFFRGFFVGIAEDMAKQGPRRTPTLHRYNPKDPSEDGGPGTGYWYNDNGERCWNGDD